MQALVRIVHTAGNNPVSAVPLGLVETRVCLLKQLVYGAALAGVHHADTDGEPDIVTCQADIQGLHRLKDSLHHWYC